MIKSQIKIKTVIAGTICILPILFTIHLAKSQPANAGIQRWALLIGINEYKSQQIRSLKGCVADVENMRDILVHRFGFPESNIKMILNQQATTKNINKTVQSHLLKNNSINQNDVVLLYYAGHGSQQVDENNDEPDGMDETIVPHDARAGGAEITDDEIGNWLVELRKKTSHLTFILDACHSGSATRDPYSQVRYLPPETGAKSTRSAHTRTYSQSSKGSDWIRPESGYTLLSACMHFENAHEFKVENQVRGVFSYHLQEILKGIDSTWTYRELLEEIGAKIAGTRYRNMQHPLVEGDLDKQIFSGIAFSRPPHFQISNIKDNRVTIDAGSVHLMTRGSILGIYPKEVKQTGNDNNCVAKLVTEKVLSTTSQCRILTKQDKIELCNNKNELSNENKIQFKVVELQHNFGELTISVAAEEVEDPAVNKRIKKILDSLPFVKNTSIEKADAIFSTQGDTLYGPLIDSSCIKPVNPLEIDYEAKIETELLRLAQRKNLAQLRNSFSKLKLRAEILKNIDSVENVLKRPPLSYITNLGPEQLAVGDSFQIRVYNDSNQPGWISVLDLQTDGGVGVLYPIGGAQDNLLPPGQSFVIPANEIYVVQEPLGLEMLKVIMTTKPANFESAQIPGCNSDVLTIRSGVRSVIEEPKSPLEMLIQHPLLGTRASYEPIPIDDWTTATIRFEVIGSKETTQK